MWQVDQFNLCACQVRRCRGDIQPLECDVASPNFSDGGSAYEDIIESLRELCCQETNSARGISLWIPVYEKHPLFGDCKTCGQINGRSCFPYTAFLIGHRYDFAHSHLED